MAIVREYYRTRNDGVKLYRTYSDENYMIQKVGTEEIYEEAIDVEDAAFEYEETDELIEESNESELKAQAYDILMGEVE
jgi:hypothetical protein